MSSGRAYDPVRPLANVDTNRQPPILPPPNMLMNRVHTGVVLPPISSFTNENAFPQPAPKSLNPLPGMKQNLFPLPVIPAIAQMQPMPVPSVPKQTTTQPQKRKSDVQEPATEVEISDDDPRLDAVHESCNQIRSKIRRYIESGASKVGEFQKTLGVSSAAYTRFMNQTGPDAGSGSDVYYNAARFFKKRELMGLKAVPAIKKPRISMDGNKHTDDSFGVSGVKLDGEETGDVPVYDTCDEIRKKIRAFLRKEGVSKAALCRAIGASFPEKRGIQGKQLDSFLGKKGPTAGNTSGVYYGSYVFFEKLRIYENKPKTQMRLEMEQQYAGGNGEKPGMNTTEMLDRGYITLHESEMMTQDKYGRIEIINRATGKPVFGSKD